ncbi:MAG TPA: LysR family transcriptional regulator [Kofleriaceae bacterium]
MREIHDLDLNLVTALDALLVEKHVTRAAQRLGITQSAASHALARLRDQLGDPLLVRGPRGAMVPTPLAQRIGPQLRKILDDLATVLRGETFDPMTARRSFQLGGSDYVELVLLPKLAVRLAKEAPGVDVWVKTFEDWGDRELANGSLDAVICPPMGANRPSGSYEKVLLSETFTVVMRTKHPLAQSRLTIARYCDAKHLMVSPRGTPGSFVDDALAAIGKTRRIAMVVPHFLVVPYVIAETDLVATLAHRIAKLFATSLDLVAVPPPLEIPRFQMALAWHERNHHDVAQRWFRNLIHEVAASA